MALQRDDLRSDLLGAKGDKKAKGGKDDHRLSRKKRRRLDALKQLEEDKGANPVTPPTHIPIPLPHLVFPSLSLLGRCRYDPQCCIHSLRLGWDIYVDVTTHMCLLAVHFAPMSDTAHSVMRAPKRSKVATRESAEHTKERAIADMGRKIKPGEKVPRSPFMLLYPPPNNSPPFPSPHYTERERERVCLFPIFLIACVQSLSCYHIASDLDL